MPIYQDLSSAALLENAGQEQLANSLGTSRALSAGGTLKKVTEMQERGATQRHAMDIGMQNRALQSTEKSADLDREWQTNMMELKGEIEAKRDRAYSDFFKAVESGRVDLARNIADMQSRSEANFQSFQGTIVSALTAAIAKQAEGGGDPDVVARLNRRLDKMEEEYGKSAAGDRTKTETGTLLVDPSSDPEVNLLSVTTAAGDVQGLPEGVMEKDGWVGYATKVKQIFTDSEAKCLEAIIQTGQVPEEWAKDRTALSALFHKAEVAMPLLAQQFKDHAEVLSTSTGERRLQKEAQATGQVEPGTAVSELVKDPKSWLGTMAPVLYAGLRAAGVLKKPALGERATVGLFTKRQAENFLRDPQAWERESARVGLAWLKIKAAVQKNPIVAAQKGQRAAGDVIAEIRRRAGGGGSLYDASRGYMLEQLDALGADHPDRVGAAKSILNLPAGNLSYGFGQPTGQV